MTNETLVAVFERIKSAGPHGIDDYAVAELVGIASSTARNLRLELLRRGIVKLSPVQRRGRCGRFVHVWVWTGIDLD
jgi:predicted transcriptional regulator